MECLLEELAQWKDMEALKEHMYTTYCIQIKWDDKRILLRYRKEDGADMTSPLVQCCRSLIVDRLSSTPKPVCRTFSAKQEYDMFREENEYSSVTVSPYYDGTMINVYNILGKWYHSTKGMLDANKAYWTSSQSFGELFQDASGGLPYDLLDTLDPELCYSFVLQHPENRIVTPIDAPRVVLVLVLNRITGESIPLIDLPKELWTEQIHAAEVSTESYANYEELETAVQGMSGVFLTGPSGHTRLMSPEYSIVAGLRGNSPNHTHNLLENINEGSTRRNLYLHYYPEDSSELLELQQFQEQLLLDTEMYYKKIYIENKYTTMPPYIQKWVHDIHRRNRHRSNRSDSTDLHRFIKGVYHSLPLPRRAYLIKGVQAQLSDMSVVKEEGTLPL